MSRTKTFVRTLAPPSLHTLAAADSNAQPLRPNTPAVAQAATVVAKGVKWDGHTDNCEQSGGGANEVCGGGARGKGQNQTSHSGQKGNS